MSLYPVEIDEATMRNLAKTAKKMHITIDKAVSLYKQSEYRRLYRADYNQLPEVKAKRHEYNQRPEVKAKRHEYNQQIAKLAKLVADLEEEE